MGISNKNRRSSSFLLSEPSSTKVSRPRKLRRGTKSEPLFESSQNSQINHKELESDSDLGYDGDIETSPRITSATMTVKKKINLVAKYFPESRAEDLAIVESVFGSKTLAEVPRVLSPEVRESAVESMVYEARFLSDGPAGKHTKAIVNAIVGEIVEANSELERIAGELEFHRSFSARPQEHQESNRGEREASDQFSMAGFDLKLVEVPFDESGFDLSTQSSLGKAILEIHDLIARQEEEEELKPDDDNCDKDKSFNDSPRSVLGLKESDAD